MIRGRVSSDGTAALEARVAIDIAAGDRDFQAVDVVVDTGFTGWLTLPGSVIRQLGLGHYGQRPAILASGETTTFDIYGAFIQWHGQDRPAIVHQAEGKPLMGMALLNGSRLLVDAWEGGDVIIDEYQIG